MLPSVSAACLTISAQATRPRDDTQIWTETQVAIPLKKKIDLMFLNEVRFGRNVSRPVDERIGGGILFQIGKYLTLFPFYLHVTSQPTASHHSTDRFITLEGSVKLPVGRFTIKNRNRVEFHISPRASNFIQYRNRTQVEHPVKFHRIEINPYLADEVFYDSIANAWIRNRFFAGAAKKINRHFTLDLYYLRQNDSHSHPGDINALGSTFKFRL